MKRITTGLLATGTQLLAQGISTVHYYYWNGGHNPFITNPPTYYTHYQYGWHQWRRDDENPIRVETMRGRKELPPHE